MNKTKPLETRNTFKEYNKLKYKANNKSTSDLNTRYQLNANKNRINTDGNGVGFKIIKLPWKTKKYFK